MRGAIGREEGVWWECGGRARETEGWRERVRARGREEAGGKGCAEIGVYLHRGSRRTKGRAAPEKRDRREHWPGPLLRMRSASPWQGQQEAQALYPTLRCAKRAGVIKHEVILFLFFFTTDGAHKKKAFSQKGPYAAGRERPSDRGAGRKTALGRVEDTYPFLVETPDAAAAHPKGLPGERKREGRRKEIHH